MHRLIRRARQSLLVKVFHAGQRLRLDILPRHFYSEIPDIRELRRTEHWRQPFPMFGVRGVDPDSQLAFARSVVSEPLRRRIAEGGIHASACRTNGGDGYGPIEADFLFAFVASVRPKRIVQIGCGVSTAVVQAAAAAAGYAPEITCIDPFPSAFLERAASEGAISLVAKPAQEVGYEFLSGLEDGDLFFVDSSHTLGPAGEVSRIVLEMLPRLRKGVYVHFHDILLPFDYATDVLTSALFFTHETALLLAFLSYNPRFEILASLSLLHYQRREHLMGLMPNYRPREEVYGLGKDGGHFPSSIFLRVVS